MQLEFEKKGAIIYRPYQIQAAQQIYLRRKAGVSRMLYPLPTGGGKTLIAAMLPTLFPNERGLFMAHRDTLLEQAGRAFLRSNPNLLVSIEQANKRASTSSDVVLLSVQSGGRGETGRKRLARHLEFDWVVADEAHHSPSQTYLNILEQQGYTFGKERKSPEGKLLLGLTATPKRSDNKGLNKVFDELIPSKSILWMIDNGYLCDIVYHGKYTGEYIDVPVKAGEYVRSELSLALNKPTRNEIIFESYKKHAVGSTIIFCVDVAHVHAVTNLFNKNGVKAVGITGTTPPDYKAWSLREFKAGKIPVLVNCMVATEGVDATNIGTVILARVTKSQSLYIQMLGRGLRTNVNLSLPGYTQPYLIDENISFLEDTTPSDYRLESIAGSGKPHCVFIDLVDNHLEHSPIMLPTLYGVEAKEIENKPISKVIASLKESGYNFQFGPDREEQPEQRSITLQSEEAAIWKLPTETPKEILKYSKFEWMKVGNAYRLSIHPLLTLELNRTEEGWIAYRQSRGTVDKKGNVLSRHKLQTVPLNRDPDRDTGSIFSRCDEFVSANYPFAGSLLSQDAAWKNDPVSPEQIAFLRRLKRTVTERPLEGGGVEYSIVVAGKPVVLSNKGLAHFHTERRLEQLRGSKKQKPKEEKVRWDNNLG